MDARMTQMGVGWPRFQASDLRDLHAYLRRRGNAVGDSFGIAGDPERGWNLFQQKGCIRCHALSPDPGRTGPSLGPERQLPPSFSEFGAALLNHFPQMQNAVQSEETRLPQLEANDLTDIAVFLYSLHYLEPSGSPQVGKSVFSWRGCGRCHGDEAQGTAAAPGLRGRGQTYTVIRLATDLWRHGALMYQTSVEEGQPWPVLQESDIGHLLTFLNTSPQR
jgi:cytochrome c551/c552